MYILYNLIVLINICSNIIFVVLSFVNIKNLLAGEYNPMKIYWIIYFISILFIIVIPENDMLREIFSMPIKN